MSPSYASFDPSDEVVDDPDFLVPLTVYRSTSAIGPNGIALVTAVVPGGVVVDAIVTADPGRDLIITDSGGYVQSDLKIVTRFPLTNGDAMLAADEVGYNGMRFRVLRCQPYLYGRGWYKARAKSISINPDPVGPNDTVAPKPPQPGGFLDR